MTRFFIYLIASNLMLVVSTIVAPILPAFRETRIGPSDNANSYLVEPRLPKWLMWFDTLDNSLWGDKGWQTIHCPEYKSYWGMVKWLLRNSANGFQWVVLASENINPENINYGGNPAIDKNRPDLVGQYFFASHNDYFQYKTLFKITESWGMCLKFGWQLDTYITHPDTHLKQPNAQFLFAPRFVRF